MVEHLARELAGIRHGDHICLPYECANDCDAAIAPFVGEGLARGERCAYVVEASERETLLAMLAAAGVNASRALDRGALRLLTPGETYFRGGHFDPDDTLALVDELVTGALADGFTGLRASGEIAAPDRQGADWAKVFSYEARFNERFAKRPVVALCRYHHPASPPAMIADALRTHPTAIVGGRVCPNPYYEAPDIALAADGGVARLARLEWRLRHLRRTSAKDLRAREMIRSLADETSRLSAENQSHAEVEDELQRSVRVRDQFLDQLIQELSGPVAGLANEIQALAHPPSDGLGRHFKRLGALVEELKEVAGLTNRAALVVDDIDLADVARQVTLRNRARLAVYGSTVSVKTEARVAGRWDRRRIEQLVTNLLLNAGKRGAGRPIDLEVCADGTTAIITLRLRGDAHQTRKTTKETHRGTHTHKDTHKDTHKNAHKNTNDGFAEADLWVSREIAGALGGTLRLAPQAGAERTTVITVELPRSEPRMRSLSRSAP